MRKSSKTYRPWTLCVSIVAILFSVSSCGSGGGSDNGDNQNNQVASQDAAAFFRAVDRTCSRLGLAFTQTDVRFLLHELRLAIQGTCYRNSHAVNELRMTCPQ